MNFNNILIKDEAPIPLYTPSLEGQGENSQKRITRGCAPCNPFFAKNSPHPFLGEGLGVGA